MRHLMIELSKTEASTQRGRSDAYSDIDDVGENREPVSLVVKITVNPDNIRCFYPRRGGQPGTRITFADGGGFVVVEDYAAVRDKLAAVGALA